MKKLAIWMVAGLMAAGAWGARHAVKADGRLSALQADGEPVSPLEWEYAGRIVDEDGKAVTGAATLVARLYGAAEGGDVLWARKAPVLLDENGDFSVLLSDVLEAPEGAPETTLARVLAEHTCWIECQLDGHSGVMVPRAGLAAAPYAMFANAAEGARGDFLASVSLVVGGATTAGSISTGNATSEGAVKVGGELKVGGDATMAGGLKAASYSGIGALPVGTVILWYGFSDQAPDGWAFCDGQNRPDLGGRFVVGAGNRYHVGDTGGAETVTLSGGQLPPHSHGYELRDDNNRDKPDWIGENHGVWHGGDKTVQTTSSGGGQPHENLPPYRALRYIVRVE